MDAWLDRLQNEIKEATKDLLEADWFRAPKGAWNSAQILEHLGRSYGTTAKMLEFSMDSGVPPRVRPASLSEFLKKVLVVDFGVMPSGTRSPQIVAPKGDSGPVALERVFVNLERMDSAIALAEERWGSKDPIALHPVLGPLNAGQWRKFHYIHGHHHVLQMQKRLGKKQPT